MPLCSARARLLTYNVHSGVGLDGKYDLQRIGRVVAHAAPDILCLQEVEKNSEVRAARKWSHAHLDDQATVVAREAGLEHVHFFAAINASYDSSLSSDGNEVLRADTCAAYGVAIASKFPVLGVFLCVCICMYVYIFVCIYTYLCAYICRKREKDTHRHTDTRTHAERRDLRYTEQESEQRTLHMDSIQQPRGALVNSP
jgi:hypothetical protein